MIVSYWFKEKLSLATGIGVAGSGFGIFIFALLSNWLFENYGWRGALLFLAGLMSTTVMFGALFRDVPNRVRRENEKSLKEIVRHVFDFRIIRTCPFAFYLLTTCLISLVYFVPIIWMPERVVKSGAGTRRNAAFLMGMNTVSF